MMSKISTHHSQQPTLPFLSFHVILTREKMLIFDFFFFCTADSLCTKHCLFLVLPLFCALFVQIKNLLWFLYISGLDFPFST